MELSTKFHKMQLNMDLAMDKFDDFQLISNNFRWMIEIFQDLPATTYRFR